jgi:hypothetical protein
MVKKAVVTKVTGNGTWEGQYGLMYKWEIEFDNGDFGNAMTKQQSQATWKIGEEIEYELTERLTPNGTFYNVKAIAAKPAGGFGGGGGGYKKDPETEARITRMSVLNRAVDMACHGLIEAKDIIPAAEKFEAWVYAAVAKK